MTKEARERKRNKYESKFAPISNCPCGRWLSIREKYGNRCVWECEHCGRSVFANKEWEVSVGWYLGMFGQVDGMVKQYGDIK